MPGFEDVWLPEVIREFEAANPGVKVEVESVTGNYINKMPVDIAAGTAPDVFQGWGGAQRSWAESSSCSTLILTSTSRIRIWPGIFSWRSGMPCG